jgi:hypothetical protein
MTIKQLINRLKENNQENSMSYKFFSWMQKKDKNKCRVCGSLGVNNEFSNEQLCFSCYYDLLQEKQK